MATFPGINNVGVNGLPIFAVYTYRREIVRFCIENDAWQIPPVELQSIATLSTRIRNSGNGITECNAGTTESKNHQPKIRPCSNAKKSIYFPCFFSILANRLGSHHKRRAGGVRQYQLAASKNHQF